MPVTPTTAQILLALSRGLDPATGEALPAETVLRRAEIVRALQDAARVLENPARRRGDRTWHAPLPPKTGSPWSEKEDGILRNGHQNGRSVPELAADLGRTPNAVATRLERIGIATSVERADG
jgi:hypothetical protein